MKNISDDIIETDEYCIVLNHEILKLEREFLPLLQCDALEKYLKIDELATELTNHISDLLYRQFYDNTTNLR